MKITMQPAVSVDGYIALPDGDSEIIESIKNNYDFSELILCGGGEVNGMLAEAGLIDEIVVSVQPIVLGQGIPLFGNFKPALKLNLLSTNQDIEGVTQDHYQVIK